MISKYSEYSYYSTVGKVCIVPRPTLVSYNLQEGIPRSVNYPDPRYYTEAEYKQYYDLKGIQVKDYQRIKPDLVVYQLADGSYLAATSEVIEASQVDFTSGYHSECFITPVSSLIPLVAKPTRATQEDRWAMEDREELGQPSATPEMLDRLANLVR